MMPTASQEHSKKKNSVLWLFSFEEKDYKVLLFGILVKKICICVFVIRLAERL